MRGRSRWHHSRTLRRRSWSSWSTRHWHSHGTWIAHWWHSRSLHHPMWTHLWTHWHSITIRSGLHRTRHRTGHSITFRSGLHRTMGSHPHSWIVHSHWTRMSWPHSSLHRCHWIVRIYSHIWRSIWRLLLHSGLHSPGHGHSRTIVRIHIVWRTHRIVSRGSRRHTVIVHIRSHMIVRVIILRHLSLSHGIGGYSARRGHGIRWELRWLKRISWTWWLDSGCHWLSTV